MIIPLNISLIVIGTTSIIIVIVIVVILGEPNHLGFRVGLKARKP